MEEFSVEIVAVKFRHGLLSRNSLSVILGPETMNRETLAKLGNPY